MMWGLWFMTLLRRAREAAARVLGNGRVFTTDVEVDKRAAYARRTATS